MRKMTQMFPIGMFILALINSSCSSVRSDPNASGSPSISEQGKTYYVRPDGGSNERCNGLANAPDPGNGTAQPCAWDHPFRALPPGSTPNINGGDTLLIANGSYQMGYGAPNTTITCEPESSYDCLMPPIPSGPDVSHPTRILGNGWDSGCPTPPELWGAGRSWYIIDLSRANNVEVACLEITDHSTCVESHSGGLACEQDTVPYGDWAAVGLYAEDSANVYLHHLNIHGLGVSGIHAGRLTDWTVEDVRIVANGWGGWDGDIDGEDSNQGTLTFRRWMVAWNGCGETWPDGQPIGCWGLSAGGYGDGVGTGATGGDWVIEDSTFLHNTSDGLDLLYHKLGGTITLNRVHAEGNAGNQIQLTGQTNITNAVLVGNCAFFDGQPFTFNVEPCRALGNTLDIKFTGGEQTTIINTTFYGQGDGLLSASALDGYTCIGTETLKVRNSIFLGDQDYFDPSDQTFLFYQENCANLKLDSDFNIISSVKNFTCGGHEELVNSGNHDLCQDPQLAGPFSGPTYGMALSPNSPAIDAGNNTYCPDTDILGLSRPQDRNEDGTAICNLGAYE